LQTANIINKHVRRLVKVIDISSLPGFMDHVVCMHISLVFLYFT